MKRLAIALVGIVFASSVVFASDDPIATRKSLMDSNAAAAGVAAGMLKGDIPYDPAVAKAAIMALNATAHAYGDYFPEGSDMGNTSASPKIWEDMAGFKQKLGDFQTAVASAVDASGRSGPADIDAFKTAIGPVFGTCKSCHEAYRLKN
jgi:cytochrome c556